MNAGASGHLLPDPDGHYLEILGFPSDKEIPVAGHRGPAVPGNRSHGDRGR
jgi:hypothetical protein